MTCQSTNARGEPCGAPAKLVGDDGFCPTHRPGGLDRVRAASAKGGAANRAKHEAAGMAETELAPILTVEDAKRELDAIRRAILTHKIRHAEGTAAGKVVAEWVRAHGVGMTQQVINELRRELDARKEENEELRRQIAKLQRPGLRVARA